VPKPAPLLILALTASWWAMSCPRHKSAVRSPLFRMATSFTSTPSITSSPLMCLTKRWLGGEITGFRRHSRSKAALSSSMLVSSRMPAKDAVSSSQLASLIRPSYSDRRMMSYNTMQRGNHGTFVITT